jgi:plasmid stabilization system protein ParE
MNVRFHPAAEQELDDAMEWYDGQRLGLGREFSAAARESQQRIERYPHWGTEIRPGVRRTLIKKFPYAIIYAIAGHDLVIYAVAHLHRRPGYWRDRLS